MRVTNHASETTTRYWLELTFDDTAEAELFAFMMRDFAHKQQGWGSIERNMALEIAQHLETLGVSAYNPGSVNDPVNWSDEAALRASAAAVAEDPDDRAMAKALAEDVLRRLPIGWRGADFLESSA